MSYQEAVKKLRKITILTQPEFSKFKDVSFATSNSGKTGRFSPTIKTKRKLIPLFKKYKIEVENE